jgi:hypothetical protein
MKNMEIDIEQCRENDKIKDIISKSGLPIKHIKLLLRLSDTIYINALNYNVIVEGKKVIIVLISSKPENKSGSFHTYSLTNILYKVRGIDKENDDVETWCEVDDGFIKIIMEIK